MPNEDKEGKKFKYRLKYLPVMRYEVAWNGATDGVQNPNGADVQGFLEWGNRTREPGLVAYAGHTSHTCGLGSVCIVRALTASSRQQEAIGVFEQWRGKGTQFWKATKRGHDRQKEGDTRSDRKTSLGDCHNNQHGIRGLQKIQQQLRTQKKQWSERDLVR